MRRDQCKGALHGEGAEQQCKKDSQKRLFEKGFKFWFSQDICPSVGFLGHRIVLFLLFKGTSLLFSIVTALIYLLSKSAEGFPFLHKLTSIYCL